MQCVEFEVRLNDLLDERISPTADMVLSAHAQSCANCSELLAAHEILLEGVQTLPLLQLPGAKREALAKRVVAEVGSMPAGPFPTALEVELADCRQAAMAKNVGAKDIVTPWAMIGLLLATAAAVIIAMLPWFRDAEPSNRADSPPSIIANEQKQSPLESPGPTLALKSQQDLEPIAWVGYQVADGLQPVTNSMVSALRELRKRPLFRNAEENGRSSFYLPRDLRENVA